ncbi:MAG: type VI secretion system tip protein VgrG [Proteobacteria bacterium]|nr:type VI secretion system tip protein VgrG [Pseudomonadota bacterium]
MSEAREIRYEFTSAGLPEDTFSVIGFSGREGLNRIYEFEIRLVSTEPDVDPAAVVGARATFTIRRPTGDLVFHGWPAWFEEGRSVDPYVFYRAVLVPKLHWLTLTRHNQVMLKMDLPELLTAALKDGGLDGHDFELRLQETYPVREYICQYDESHFDFVSRWMEYHGLYFFFEQGPDKEKMVITDSPIGLTRLPGRSKWIYAPPSGLDDEHVEEIVTRFSLSRSRIPAKVLLKSYNYEKPSLELSGEAEVAGDGLGEIYEYGEPFQTPEEGARVAKVRAETWRAGEKIFHAASFIPYVSAGFLYDLSDHFRQELNGPYLVTDVTHQGRQSRFFLKGLGMTLTEEEKRPVYANEYTAIPAGVRFRPERRTPWPRISGTLPAVVDASGSGQYAELDDQGRYKIRLPFDLSGRGGGKASHWVRMAQPYAGSGYGFHAPLHKGVEVMLTFVDGDPDRPIIASAAPNPDNSSPVTDTDQAKSRMRSAGGNWFEMDDTEGAKGMHFASPTSSTFMSLGRIHTETAAQTKPTEDKAGAGSQGGASSSASGSPGGASSSGPTAVLELPARDDEYLDEDAGLIFLTTPDGSLQAPLGRLDPAFIEAFEQEIEQRRERNETLPPFIKDIGSFFEMLGKGIGELGKSIWEANKSGGWQPFKNNDDGFHCSSKSSWGKYVGQDLTINVGGNSCKVIVGGEEAVVLGFKMSLVALLYLSLILGGRLTLRVPLRFQSSNKHGETAEELIHAMDAQIDILNTSIQTLGDKTTAVNSKIEALESENTAAGQKVDLLDQKIQAVNQKTVAVAQKTKAVSEVLKAVNSKDEAVASKIREVMTETNAAITRSVTLGIKIDNGQEKTQVANTFIQSAQAAISDAEEQDL